MAEYLELGTTILLFIFFAAFEIYRLTRPARGKIIGIEPIAYGLGGYEAEVELETGKIVKAYVSTCTMCAGRLTEGSEVIVHKTKDGFVVSLPIACKCKG